MPQMNDNDLLLLSNQIKNETISKANTALRVGTLFQNIIQSKINNASGTTSGVTTVKFNTYTGITAPATYQSKTSIALYTGTTVPTTYLTKSSFNTYSGLTNNRIVSLETNFISGATNLGGFSLFTSVSAHKIQFKGLVAGSNIALTPSSTGITISALASGTISGATNGLSLSGGGKKIKLGGNLTGTTNIGLNSNDLIFTGTTGTLKYASNLSTNYTIRSIVDKGFVTGLTSLITTTTGSSIILNFNNNVQQMFKTGSAVNYLTTTGITITLSNNTNALVFNWVVFVNGNINMTLPSNFQMPSNETRWNSGAKKLTLNYINKKIELGGTYDGTSWALKATLDYI